MVEIDLCLMIVVVGGWSGWLFIGVIDWELFVNLGDMVLY